jgi:cytochrome c oxidase cbb3-type subunit I/II
MEDPRSMSPGSIMPAYPWLLENALDVSSTPAKINAMRKIGVPYDEGYENLANRDLTTQADKIVASLKESGIKTSSDKEIIALIAYLQRLGMDIKGQATAK